MFEQMGYKHTGLGILILEGPIDPDKVSSVSRDAIVAFVECQVIYDLNNYDSHISQELDVMRINLLRLLSSIVYVESLTKFYFICILTYKANV